MNINTETRTDPPSPAKNVGCKRMIDETKLTVGLRRHKNWKLVVPTIASVPLKVSTFVPFPLSNNGSFLLPVPFYLNYISSSAARKRNKEKIAELQKMVDQLTKETSILRSVNESKAVHLQKAVQINLMLQELAGRSFVETYNGNAAGLLGFLPVGQVSQEATEDWVNLDQTRAEERDLGAPVNGLECIFRASAADGPNALLRLSILKNLHEERLATAKRLRAADVGGVGVSVASVADPRNISK